MCKTILMFVFVMILIAPAISMADCHGTCGDANQDAKFTISDAVYLINYIFRSGYAPQPVLACGDVNGDCKVNVSDVIEIVAYVFLYGPGPSDCCAGGWDGQGGDCCPFPSK